MMRRHEFINEAVAAEILALIHQTADPAVLAERLNDYHDYDIAQALEQLTPEERLGLFLPLGALRLAEILPYCDEPEQVLAGFPADKAAAILDSMDSDEAAEILEELPEETRRLIAGHLSEETSGEIRMIASYTDDEIGSMMTTNYIAIPQTASVKEAMRELIRQSAENDNISTLYVIDDQGLYCGAIDLKDLIRARDYTSLDKIIVHSYPFVHDHDQIEECMDWISDYEEDSLPVLNAADQLVGVLTVQDIMDYREEESREVYNKLAGISEGTDDDLDEPLLLSMKKRLPWLVILLFLGMFVSSVVGMFEQIVAQIAILICFQSLILDMAGNVGTQSLAVTIRVLTDEALPMSEKLHLISKEVRVGLTNGTLLGVIAFGVVTFYTMVLKHYPLSYSMAVGACVAIALMLAMTISSFAGTAIPMVFDKFGVDPAVASGPLITTVNDLVAVISYYGLAWLMLIQVFHLVCPPEPEPNHPKSRKQNLRSCSRLFRILFPLFQRLTQIAQVCEPDLYTLLSIGCVGIADRQPLPGLSSGLQRRNGIRCPR